MKSYKPARPCRRCQQSQTRHKSGLCHDCQNRDRKGQNQRRDKRKHKGIFGQGE